MTELELKSIKADLIDCYRSHARSSKPGHAIEIFERKLSNAYNKLTDCDYKAAKHCLKQAIAFGVSGRSLDSDSIVRQVDTCSNIDTSFDNAVQMLSSARTCLDLPNRASTALNLAINAYCILTKLTNDQ